MHVPGSSKIRHFVARQITAVGTTSSRAYGIQLGRQMGELDRRSAQRPGQDLRVPRIAERRLRERIELAWRRDGPLSPAARALIALARERVVPVAGEVSETGRRRCRDAGLDVVHRVARRHEEGGGDDR